MPRRPQKRRRLKTIIHLLRTVFFHAPLNCFNRAHAVVFFDLTVKVFSARKFSRLLFEISFSPARTLAYCFIPQGVLKVPVTDSTRSATLKKRFRANAIMCLRQAGSGAGTFCVSSHGLSALNLRCAWINCNSAGRLISKFRYLQVFSFDRQKKLIRYCIYAFYVVQYPYYSPQGTGRKIWIKKFLRL